MGGIDGDVARRLDAGKKEMEGLSSLEREKEGKEEKV